MEELIDKLSVTLEQIESYHGTAQDLSTYTHVKQLHRQARELITQLRKLAPFLISLRSCPMPEQVITDKRMQTIIEDLALTEPICHDICPWCREYHAEPIAGTTLDKTQHKSDCLIILARQILQDQGTPVGIYRVTYEFQNYQSKQWESRTSYTLALSEADAVANYRYVEPREIRAEFVQVFPLFIKEPLP
jgi:hypothetical protein